MRRAVEALRTAKYMASRQLSPKVYWYLMGRFRAVAAVTSEFEKVEDSLASGATIVELLDRLGVLDAEAVTLQIGSGIGRVEYHLHERVKKCYGVDISASMVQRARSLVTHDNVEFVETDGTILPWPDGFFDLIYSFLVFQHMPRTQFLHYLDHSFSKLKVGGHLVCQVPIDEAGSHPDPPAGHPYGMRYYRRADVEDALAGAGFSMVTRTDLRGERDDGSTTSGDVVFCGVKT